MLATAGAFRVSWRPISGTSGDVPESSNGELRGLREAGLVETRPTSSAVTSVPVTLTERGRELLEQPWDRAREAVRQSSMPAS